MKTKAFTVVMGMITMSLMLALIVGTGRVTASSIGSVGDDTNGGRSPCGFSELIQVEGKGSPNSPTASYIVDSWTTNLPHQNPWSEVTSFQIGVDTVAFVTEYYFAEGGFIPQQYIRCWLCGTYIKRGTCEYDWSIGPLPPGFTWLLINYYPPGEDVINHPNTYDWATKVGTSVFGYPAAGNRPDCFTLAY